MCFEAKTPIFATTEKFMRKSGLISCFLGSFQGCDLSSHYNYGFWGQVIDLHGHKAKIAEGFDVCISLSQLGISLVSPFVCSQLNFKSLVFYIF